MANLAHNLVLTGREHGDRPAIRLHEQTLTYTALRTAAAAVAADLTARGIGAGDRVALALPNVPAFPIVCYGAWWVGATVVPLNPLLKPREMEFLLSDSAASLVYTWTDGDGAAAKAATEVGIPYAEVGTDGPDDAGRPSGADPVERAGDDTAVILYTSGTTGRPKGAELTHHNLDSNARVAIETLFDITADDVVLGCMPLSHVFGLTACLNACVIAGACLTLLPRFDAGQALSMIARDRVTVFGGVPTMYAGLLHHPDAAGADLSSLRTCISGGASLPVELMRAFEERFGCEILEGYGLSETSPLACFNHPGHERKAGSIGFPVRGCELKLVDDAGAELGTGVPGEIAIRGENVMKGYWRQPDVTAAQVPDGWFRTGDIATRDEDGYYVIVDRKKDVVIRGGYNVYPREVEEVLYGHPAVAEVAVVGVPDDRLGEEVGAAVVLRPGAAGTPDDLREYARERLAAYKYPRRIWFVDALPKGNTGKVLRRAVVPPPIGAVPGE